MRCTNSQYLLDGECVSKCPKGYSSEGSNTNDRVCELKKRRSLQSEALIEDRPAPHNSATLLALGGAFAALIVLAALVVVARIRRAERETDIESLIQSESDSLPHMIV